MLPATYPHWLHHSHCLCHVRHAVDTSAGFCCFPQPTTHHNQHHHPCNFYSSHLMLH
ncbi:hypothetical protein LINGRAHAP2_LOCUS24931, partial [Linum grandiflorum]